MSSDTIDWSLCALCQQRKSAKNKCLQCPGNTSKKSSNPRLQYSKISERLRGFDKLNSLPFKIKLCQLDEGDGISKTFIRKKAKWHRNCVLKISATRLKQLSNKRKRDEEDEGDENSSTPCINTHQTTPFTRKYVKSTHKPKSETCFFCGESSSEHLQEQLHDVCTFSLDARVRQCAHELADRELIAKLSEGDLIAIEAKYHLNCLNQLYNRTRSVNRQVNNESDDSSMLRGIALAELIAHIEEAHVTDGTHVFKLAELTDLYHCRVKEMGLIVPQRENSTRLKQRLLAQLPHLHSYRKGKDVYLAYNDEIASVLGDKYKTDVDEQSVLIVKLAKLLRCDILNNTTTFTGMLDKESQVNAVPNSLIHLISMLLTGPTIRNQTNCSVIFPVVLTIAQLIMFNTAKKRGPNTKRLTHNTQREPPGPVYIALKIHALTKKKQLIDTMHSLGISISYDRLMDIITSMGKRICDFYQETDVVCPPQLCRDVFTIAAYDNIDHNPSSTTSTSSYHGTGISLFQPSNTNMPFNDRYER